MRLRRRAATIWANLFQAARKDRELDAELTSYVDLLTAEKLAAGEEPARARRAALLEAGGVDQVKEAVRDVRAGALLDHAARDARYALRALRRSPGFAAAAILALALGVGVTTSIFTLVYGVLLRPLPYPDSGELMRVWMSNPAAGFERDIAAYPQLLAWRERNRSFEQVVAVRGLTRNLTGAGDPEELRGQAVTEGYFEMMGVAPLLGAGFTPEQAGPDGTPAVVLSHSFWTARFGADPDIVGKTLQLSGAAVPVSGVMPAGFGDVQIWMPLQISPGPNSLREAWGALWLPVYGRLRDGVTVESAQADMARVARELEVETPAAEGSSILIEPLHEVLVGGSRTPLLLLLGAVVFVLLIACANIANLLLARSTARKSELAVRVALGASRGALIRQVMIESLVLGLIGGALGSALAWAGVQLLVDLGEFSLPRLESVRIDGAVLAFSLLLSVGASLLFGTAPAFDVARYQPGMLLRGAGRGAVRGASGVRPLLVAGQFALALMLLYGAGLLMRSFSNLLQVDRGFTTERLLSIELNLPAQRYSTSGAATEFYDRFLTEIRGIGGVQSSEAISTLLLGPLPQSASITIPGRQLTESEAALPVAYDAITPGLLRTINMPLLRGRPFTDADGPTSANVAIVNEAFAQRFFPGQDVVGQRFAFGAADGDSQYISIVGLVRDAKRAGADQPVIPSTFLPFRQRDDNRMQVLVRTTGDPLAIVPSVREVVRRIDPLQPLAQVRTLETELNESLAPRRFLMLLLVVFAASATVLAAIGIYGVIAYMVGRRTREFGLRMALGAQPGEVLGLVMKQAGRQVGVGVLAGVAGSIAGARLLSSQLFGVAPFDPLLQLIVIGLLALVAGTAVWLPARRATGADPLTALRAE